MRKNRAYRTVEALYHSVKHTLTAAELERCGVGNWAPRGVSEANKIPGVKIIGGNPYTLTEWPSDMFSNKSYTIIDSLHGKRYDSAFNEVPATFIQEALI